MALWTFLLAAGPIGCAQPDPEPSVLSLLEFRQAGRDDVALNEPLVFHFSAELEDASITRESVRILDPAGQEVSGRFVLKRSTLEFHPSLPLDSDLSDGGLRPGATYSVILVGFPRPDGVRARNGDPLDRTLRASFRAASREGSEGLFLDLAPRRDPPTLSLVERLLSPLDPIRLRCNEPLDPTSIEVEDFVLLEETTPVPLRVRLVENDVDQAVLELRPLGGNVDLETFRALDPGRPYFLVIDPQALQLRTLRRRGLKPFWSGLRPVPLRVVGPRSDGLVEGFANASRRSPEPYPGADGMVGWGGDAARVRFPLAAGTGRDGAVLLGSEETRADLHATSLVLPEDGLCEVRAGAGMVVLRSQGRIEIDGVLRRRSEGGRLGWRTDESHAEWRGRTAQEKGWTVGSMSQAFGIQSNGENPTDETTWSEVSRFLSEHADEGWTVLVAGADLVVTGKIETDAPLLLIAGGWVRVSGRADARETFYFPEGGGRVTPPRTKHAPLVMDEPVGANPLARTLHLASLSQPIRPTLDLVQWGAPRIEVHQGNGSARVSFLGVRETDARTTEVYGPVTDLRLLDGCQFLRFLVELEVGPGEVWDPPEVREVELSWVDPSSG